MFVYRLSDLHTPSLSKLSLLRYNSMVGFLLLNASFVVVSLLLLLLLLAKCLFGSFTFMVIFVCCKLHYRSSSPSSTSSTLCAFFLAVCFILLSNLNLHSHIPRYSAGSLNLFLSLTLFLHSTMAGVTLQRNSICQQALICYSFYCYCAILLEFSCFFHSALSLSLVLLFFSSESGFFRLWWIRVAFMCLYIRKQRINAIERHEKKSSQF